MEDNCSGSNELAILTAAERKLAACTNVDDVLEIREEAEIVRIYAQKQRLGLKLQNHAARIKIQAERRVGEALRALKLRGGDRKSNSHDESLIVRLRDMGIDRNQSSRWQQEASLSQEEFEAFCRDIETRGEELSSNALLRFVRAARGGNRRRVKPTNGQTRHQSYGATATFGEDLAEVRQHIESVDRMFQAICHRDSSHLEEIEAREIPRYLLEAVKILADMERQLGVVHRS